MGVIAAYIRVSQQTADKCAMSDDYLRRVLLEELGVNETIDIDKDWDGLHFLLSADRRQVQRRSDLQAFDIGGICLFGKRILNEKVARAYGPARHSEAVDIREILAFLLRVAESDLIAVFNAEDMDKADVYPGMWVRDREARLDDLLGSFRALKTFYGRAAAKGDTVIAFLT